MDGNFSVEEPTTCILYNKSLYNTERLSWHTDISGQKYLSIDEILEQIIKMENIQNDIPLLKINYESALWGGYF